MKVIGLKLSVVLLSRSQAFMSLSPVSHNFHAYRSSSQLRSCQMIDESLSFWERSKCEIEAFKTGKYISSAVNILCSIFILCNNGDVAVAASDKRVVGEIAASGFIFKDSLNIEAFTDSKVEGVTLYISDFSRPITERISKDFFSDPSSTSMTCVSTGTVKLADNISTSKSGEEVFEEKRSLLFKSIKVNRIVDTEKQNVIYVAYSSRIDPNSDDNKSRFKSSLCAVHYQ